MATVWVDDVTHLLPLVLTVGEGKVVRWEGNIFEYLGGGVLPRVRV